MLIPLLTALLHAPLAASETNGATFAHARPELANEYLPRESRRFSSRSLPNDYVQSVTLFSVLGGNWLRFKARIPPAALGRAALRGNEAAKQGLPGDAVL